MNKYTLATLTLMSIVAWQAHASTQPTGWDIHITDISQTKQAKNCFAVSPATSVPLPPSDASADGDSAKEITEPDHATLFFELHVLADYGRGHLTARAIAPSASQAGRHYASTGLFKNIVTEPNASEATQIFGQLIPVRIGQAIYYANIDDTAPAAFKLIKDGQPLSSMDTIREIIDAQQQETQADTHNRAQTSMNTKGESNPIPLPLAGLEAAYLEVMHCIHVANKGL